MKKIVLDFILRNQLTAGPKAREDIFQILSCKGYVRHLFVISKNSVILSVISLLLALFTIPWKCQAVVQYPLGSPTVSRWILKILSMKWCHVCVVAHDLESLRQYGKVSSLEIGNLLLADHIVVHTDNMKSLLKGCGISADKISIITLFDYIVDIPAVFSTDDDACVFAGNLQKSEFLHLLKEIPCVFKLYGTESHFDKIASDTVMYGGKFQPNDLSKISGKWGLVWDGEMIDTCSGNLGNYLKYNSPHKMSLYLAAGLPVIVWSESALASFVKQQGLGICVASLRHLNEEIGSISDIEYAQMKESVVSYAQRLKFGLNILSSIPQSFI